MNPVEKSKHTVSSITFFSENRNICEILWKNIAESGRPQCMHTACCIPKATNTLSEYVLLIAFPLHQWLHKSAYMLCYAYIAILVITQKQCVY
jgi:hypothetical protein